MSIKVTSLVWERYPEGGSELLLMLALADFADDNGSNIFPSVGVLAAKTRQSERNVQYLLRRIEECGWLELMQHDVGGRYNTRRYRIPVERVQTLHPYQPRKGANFAPLPTAKGCKPAPERVQTSVEKGAIAIAPEPSVTVIEPSVNSASGDAAPASQLFYLTKKKRKLIGWKLTAFDLFWKSWAYPKGKAEAADAWLAIPNLTAELATEIIRAADVEARRRPEIEARGGTPKWAQGWLSGRRWEDGIYQPKNETKKPVMDPEAERRKGEAQLERMRRAREQAAPAVEADKPPRQIGAALESLNQTLKGRAQ